MVLVVEAPAQPPRSGAVLHGLCLRGLRRLGLLLVDLFGHLDFDALSSHVVDEILDEGDFRHVLVREGELVVRRVDTVRRRYAGSKVGLGLFRPFVLEFLEAE